MAWTRPSLDTLVDRITTDISGRLLDGEPVAPSSVLGVLARVMAGSVHLLHGFLAWAGRQLFVDTAEEEYLERHAAIWGLASKAATRATGAVVFAGTNSVVIPAGTMLQADDGQFYATTADATIASGTATAQVTAETSGAASNMEAGASLSLTEPIAGVQSSAVAGTDGITGGVDSEEDAALRSRLLARIQEPPQGGSASDYEAWALEVSGVTRVWVYPLRMGLGTVGLTFVMDNAEVSIIPDAETVAAVQAHLDEVRPVTADVTVFAPEAVALDMNIRLTPDTLAVRAAVQAELADLIDRVAEPEGTVLLSQINEAISIAPGEQDHVVLSPTADVVMGPGQIAVLGTITWSES